MIEVLLLNRHLAHEHVVAGLATALRAGALTADAVALEARKAAQAEDEPTVGDTSAAVSGQAPATVTSLHEWRLAHLPPDTRPLPSVTPYDQLLRRRRTRGRSTVTLPRQQGLTEQAADAAIDTACRLLRLPWIRNEFNDIADRAVKDQMTYRGFLAELLTTECDNRTRRRSERRIKAGGFPRRSPCGPSTSTPTPASTRPPSTPSPAASGSRKVSRSA